MSPEQSIVEFIRPAQRIVALTGAGVSTESGIPDFRSKNGLWREVDLEKVASIEGLLDDPERFFAFWKIRFDWLRRAEPNSTHRLLARLEREGKMLSIVTQNIDGLHTKAGSQRVREVHGSYRTAGCLRCDFETTIEALFAQLDQGRTVPTCDDCGNIIRPNVVLFGELLPPAYALAQTDVRSADLLWVLGTSLEVFPVADLVPAAKRAGVPVILVNRDRGPFDSMADLVVHAELGDVIGSVDGRYTTT